MLVLSRKEGQSVYISNGIRVKVCAVHGKVVRIGFEAPAELAIHRGEVQRRIDEDGEVHHAG